MWVRSGLVKAVLYISAVAGLAAHCYMTGFDVVATSLIAHVLGL